MSNASASTDELRAGETCQRCGGFLEPGQLVRRLAGTYCAACSGRPEAVFPEAFVARHRNRRTGFLLVSLFYAIGALGLCLATRVLPLALALLPCGVVGIALFAKARWALAGLWVLPVVVGAAVGGSSGALLPGLATFACLAVVAVVVSTDIPTRLSLGKDVSVERLLRASDLEQGNPEAKSAIALACLSVVVPLMAGFAFARALQGLANANSSAKPPVGRWGTAFVAMLASLAGFWATFLGSGTVLSRYMAMVVRRR